MDNSSSTRRTSRFAALPPDERRLQATVTIQKAVRAFAARKRLEHLSTLGKPVYEALRVYHGTHDENAPGILQQGLRAQGGPGLSGLIGDHSASQGKVFYTKDKQQAAYYARTLSSVAQYDRELGAQRARDWDRLEDLRAAPVQPTVVRALLPLSVQQQATPDPKGGSQDFTIQANVQPGLVLPGHLQPDADIAQRRAAVNLFQAELGNRGVTTTPEEAATTLTRLRRNSIASDQAAIDSNYAVEGADRHLATLKFTKPF